MATKRAGTLIVTAVVVASIALCNTGAAAVQLQLKLDKGKTYYQKMVMDQKITQTVMGQVQAFDQGMGAGWKLQVLNVDAQGNMRIQYTYIWSRYKSTNPMSTVDYDSARQKSVPAGGEGFVALLDQGYVIELSPQGKVLKMEGMKEFRDAVLKKLPAGMEGGPGMQVLGPFLEEKGISEMIEGALQVYPDRPVEAGDSWTERTTLTMGFQVNVESKWTLQKLEAGVATISESSSIQSDPKGPPMDAGGMKLKFEGSGTQEGTIVIDEKTGLITSSKSGQQIKGEIKLGASAEGPFDVMAIPVAFDTQVTSEMSDKMWKTDAQ